MTDETERNQATIREAVEKAFENGEKLVIVTETNIYAQNTGLKEIEKVLKSALTIFEQEIDRNE